MQKLTAFFEKPYARALCIAAFFVCLLGIGAVAVNDYGISSDEPAMYTFGVQVYAYIFLDGPVPSAQDWSFHNGIFHVLLTSIQRIAGLESAQHIWLMRHSVTFLLFTLGVWLFFRIAETLFRSWKVALLGCIFFVFSPRLFAHAFVNPKDIPTLVAFIASFLTLLRLHQSNYARRWIFLHALTSALLVSLRSFGLLIFLLTFVAFGADAITRKTWRQHTMQFVAYLIVTLVLLTALWPLLWNDWGSNLIGAFTSSTKRAGVANPWYYIPVWMVVTTPLLYTILFAFGVLRRYTIDWLIVALWLFVPPITLILFDLHIFDGWRHVYFLYPPFLLFALRGLLLLPKKAAIAFTCISLFFTSIWMMRNHPYQFAYFSVPERITAERFDVDYWSLSYLEGLRWILEHDTSNAIPVYTNARVGSVSADLLSKEEWKRLHFVAPNRARYILQNFRQKSREKLLPDDRIVHEISVDGRVLLSIYKGPDIAGVFKEHDE